MAEAPPVPHFDGPQNAAPSRHLGSHPHWVPRHHRVLRHPVIPRLQPRSHLLGRAPVLDPQLLARQLGNSSILPSSPASATPIRQPPGPPPQVLNTLSREALRVEPPPQCAAPPAPTTTGTSQQQPPPPQQQQQHGTGTAATVQGVPPEHAKEYLLAAKAYGQQLEPNILRGEMYIESVPANALPPEQRFSTRTVAPGMAPAAECKYNMAMVAGPGQLCGYGKGMPMGGGYDDASRLIGGGYEPRMPMGDGCGESMASERRSSGTSLAAQRSRERFREFTELAEVGPQVKRLMDVGGRLEDIIDVPRKYEGPVVWSGNGYAAPPFRTRSSFESQMNATGGFGRQPMTGYDAPMQLPPEKSGPPDRYAGPFDRHNRPPGRHDRQPSCYDGPPDRYDGPPDRYDDIPDRYDRPPDRHDCPPGHYDGPGDHYDRPSNHYDRPSDPYNRPLDRYDGSPDRCDGPPDRYYRPQDCCDSPPDRCDCLPDRYDSPPPNASSYGRRAFSGENSQSVREDYELPGRTASEQHWRTTVLDLVRKIEEDIEEHCADSSSQQIHPEVAGYETDEKEEQRVRGGSLPQSRTTSPRSIRDDGKSSRARRTSSPTRCFHDYCDASRSPSPRRQPSRSWQESSSSSSSYSDFPQSRTTSPRSIHANGEPRRAWRTISPNRRYRDCDVPRRSLSL